jgi:hypothetical protein
MHPNILHGSLCAPLLLPLSWCHLPQGRKLTEVINETHENPKYLPGISLGDNVIADPNLENVVKDADIIVFCAPHQFLRGICKQLIGKVKQDAFAISLIKVRPLPQLHYFPHPLQALVISIRPSPPSAAP